jgi:FkbM family methyltransferase
MLHRLLSVLPQSTRTDLRRIVHRSRIRKGRWGAVSDPEYHLLPSLLSPGDWCIDVGANVGDYTLRMSELVGAAGRVIAVEPMQSELEVLANNVRVSPYANVTLLGIAASDHQHIAHLQVPAWNDGAVPNAYQARITSAPSNLPVLCLPLDSLALEQPVALIKVDAEGWDDHALAGMTRLIERDRPHLIVETVGAETQAWLESLGYRPERSPGSPNTLFRRPMAAGITGEPSYTPA